VVLAQDEARALQHNYIGTEHLLLGLLREEEGLAARVLESLDVTVDDVRAQVALIVGQGDEPLTPGQIPFTPRAKRVLELALREGLALGHNYIGTEHILLGLVRENNGVAARILLDFDVDAETVRKAVIDMLSGMGQSRPLAEREAEAAAANPELAAELAEAREEKELAMYASDFEAAAKARERERRLQRMLLGLPGRDVLARREHPPAAGWTAYAPARRPRPEAGLLVAGAAIFAVALAVGIAIGRLIWG